MEVGERAAHTLLERGIWNVVAERGRAMRLVGAEAERTQRGDYFLGGRPSTRLRRSALRLVRRPRLFLLPPSLHSALRHFALLAHELRSRRTLRSVVVVGPAAQPDPRHRSLAPARHLDNMVELQPRARRAAVPGLAHEGALSTIPLPDRALDLGRDVARIGARAPAWAWAPGRRELALLELANERTERPLEHRRDVPRGDLVAEQLLRVTELVVRASAHGELHCDRLRRQGAHPWAVTDMPRGMLHVASHFYPPRGG